MTAGAYCIPIVLLCTYYVANHQVYVILHEKYFSQVYYEGRLKQNNKMFDNCVKGPGFKFRLGSKEVISGWDVGIAGMKVGGKRKIVCPPAMA